MNEAQHYKAFISYSHSDRKAARWLHKSLETFRMPKRLVGAATPAGTIASRLGSIFIDRTDLSASEDLTAAVRSALEQSEYLVVVCSPEAAKSHWVNQEIVEFKRIRGDANVRCVIVGGEPLASDTPGNENNECFPEALRYRITPGGQITDDPVEPVAADLRPQGDGKRMVRLKMVAGLTGVRLDELFQRDAHRRHQRLFAATAASLVSMLIMLASMLTAMQARSGADVARNAAEQQKAEAEDLIEFMMVELREKLGPVGRLEILDAMGQKALGYYARMSPGDLDSTSLSRRARTLQLLGEIQNLRGDLDLASKAIFEAHQTTAELLARAPNEPQRLYDHAQSSYWVGLIDWQRGKLDKAEGAFQDYMALAEQLAKLDPANMTWQLELGYAHSNMGTLLMERGDWPPAVEAFSTAREIFSSLTLQEPTRLDWQVDLATTLSWLSSALQESGKLAEARKQREHELEIYQAILSEDPNNRAARYELVSAHMHMARLYLMSGQVDIALEEFEQALHKGRLRMRDDPENSISAQLTASIYLDQAEALLAGGQNRMAEHALFEADLITDHLLQRDQTVLKWQADLRCRGLVVRAHSKLLTGNLQDGLRHSALAISDLTRLQSVHPDNQGVGLLLAKAHLISGRLLAAANDEGEARSAWEQTVAILAPIGTKLKPAARANLAWATFHLGQEAEARKAIGALDQIGYQHPDFVDLKNRLINP